jgi:hypothetical protein
VDYAALRTELTTDPLNLGYAPLLAVANDWAIADLLNAKQYRGPVPLRELSAYCVTQGILGACEAVATDTQNPVELRGLCHTVLTLIRDDFRLETADVDAAAFGAAADALIGVGIMSAGQKTAMLAMAANRASRAEVLFGAGVSVGVFDVGSARNLP